MQSHSSSRISEKRRCDSLQSAYSHNTEPLKIQHIVVHLKDLIPTALLIHNSTFKTAWIVIGFVLQETIEEPKFVDLYAASQM